LSNDTLVIRGVAFLGVRLIWKLSTKCLLGCQDVEKSELNCFYFFGITENWPARKLSFCWPENYYLGVIHALLSVDVTRNTPSSSLQYGMSAVLGDSCVAIYIQ